MSALALGNPQGVVQPGATGAQNVFTGADFSTLSIRRLTKNRMAGLRGTTLDFDPSWNDILYSHRCTYDNAFPKYNRLYAALESARQLGAAVDVPNSLAQGTAFVDPRTGVTWTFSANANGNVGGFKASAAGQLVVASAGVDNVYVQAQQLTDPGLTVGGWVAVKYASSTEMLRVFRQSATNVRVERVVAGTPTTELDITVVAATDPVSGSALGIRVAGATCTVYLNGRRIASFALSATAQAFAGTGVAFQTFNDDRYTLDNMEIYNNLNLAV